MIINKRFIEITMMDLVKTGVFDDMNLHGLTNKAENGDEKAAKEIFGYFSRGDKILKNTYVNQRLDRIIKGYKIVDHEFNLITTDYFNFNLDTLSLVGSRTVEPGIEELKDRNKHWYIEGFITYEGYKQFPELYKKFKEKHSNYNCDDWDLELNVIGGIMAGNLVLDRDDLQKWRKIGINIEPWGFDKNSNMVCFTKLLIDVQEELTNKANSIREKGRIDNAVKSIPFSPVNLFAKNSQPILVNK